MHLLAIREHEQFVAPATCGDLYYVPSKFKDNASKDKRTLIHTRTRTCAIACVYTLREHEKYLAHDTCGDM
jgi:hypothetical protein